MADLPSEHSRLEMCVFLFESETLFNNNLVFIWHCNEKN